MSPVTTREPTGRARTGGRYRSRLIRASAAQSSERSAADVERPEAMLLPADLLGGDESIIFAIKPSKWYIVFDSANWVIAALLMIACASWLSEIARVGESQFMSVVLTVVALRVGLALLRWVSRFYVLTDRRVMRLRGVLKPDIFECPLVNIRNTTVTAGFPEAMTALGTITFIISEPTDRLGVWRNVADPEWVHAEVRKAIERAIDCQPHL